jgi:hypothetical protein
LCPASFLDAGNFAGKSLYREMKRHRSETGEAKR